MPGSELEPYCTWPEHFYWDRDGRCGAGWYDMEEKGCPVCFWWSICFWLAVANVKVQPPMARCDYTASHS